MTDVSYDRRYFEGVLQPGERRETLPPGCYRDPAFGAIELQKVFRKGWLGVGRADRLPKAGDYEAVKIADVPVALVRDKSGRLNAFANTCRHRGMMLLDGTGNCRVMTCPYHGWSYRLDGSLMAAPQMDQVPGFDKADHGLVPLRMAEQDGFLFLAFDQTAPDLAEWLGDFSERHAEWSLGDMVTTRRSNFEVACNWKLFLEVFNEYYHLRYVHAKSIGGIFEDPDDPDIVIGNYATQFGSHDGTSAVLDDQREAAFPGIESLQGRNRNGTRYTWLFPNMTFAAASDSMWVYEAYPIAPDRAQIVMTVCFPRSTVERADFDARADAYYRRVDVAIAEDIDVLERQQVGLASPLARAGRLAPLEPCVGLFAKWLAEKVI